jgi:hypothetical protein
MRRDAVRRIRRQEDTMPDTTLAPTLPPPAPARLLTGVWLWLWPHSGSFAEYDVPRLAAELRALGIAGVIPQAGLAAPRWCTDRVVRGFADAGLGVLVGLGEDGAHGYTGQLGVLVNAIVAALECPGAVGVMHNAEAAHDSGRVSDWHHIADAVLARHPDAPRRSTIAPWWAPLFYETTDGAGVVHKHPTHPGFPYSAFLRLCGLEIYPQDYGADTRGSPDGASARLLAWSRDASQYPALGWDAARVRPAHQTYGRTLADHVAQLLAEPHQCLWDLGGMDATCRAGLQVVAALAARGFRGPGAVAAFQAHAEVQVDGLVGPATARALGLALPAGIPLRRDTHPHADAATP